MSDKWTSTSLPYVRPRRPKQVDAWTEESASRGGSQQLLAVAEAPPPPEVAQNLGLQDGDSAVVRQRIMRIGGEPVELVDSWYPRSVAAGTPLTETRKIQGGAPTLLANLGYLARQVTEEVGIRPATTEEASQLDIREGENVLTLLRTSHTQGGQPFEVSLMVMKGPRHIRYEIEVD
ncbi:GntR family transcriptional regulator [Streptomyces sp. CBMA152]|uniref:GntR family transcriptional regulator n=1 Tax=Streptomyces sp. CBMA152 TaxID=1896312 RepID=UPI0016615946|nr:GntR family transcriptional regulator [Streptomyces sp. CBMA152]MBD0743548.1 hypothetical protein [Streptomyces sp. CBMA152]